MIIILFFIFINFGFLYLYIGHEEIVNFFNQITHIVKNVDKIHGLEYPNPFFSMNESSDGSRATKILLFFLISNFFVGSLIFLKTTFLIIQEKMLIAFIYFYSLISFKNALGRSDSSHIIVSSDWITLILFNFILFSVTYFFFKKFEKKRNITNYIHKFFPIILSAVIIVKYFNYDSLNSFGNLKNYLSTPNTKFITLNSDHEKRIQALNKISTIIKEDNCIQNFTADLSLPYLLEKPNCTKFFSSWILSGSKSETNYVEHLKKKKVKYIIYKSPLFIIDKIPTNVRLNTVNTYIQNNYTEVLNFEGYVVVKKRN